MARRKLTNVDTEAGAERIRAVFASQSYMNLQVILCPTPAGTFDVFVETLLTEVSVDDLTEMALGLLCHALPKPPLSPLVLLSPAEIDDMTILARGRTRVTKLFRAYLLLFDR
jgi:hypothetical protein